MHIWRSPFLKSTLVFVKLKSQQANLLRNKWHFWSSLMWLFWVKIIYFVVPPLNCFSFSWFNFFTDIDECSVGTNNCHANAACLNTKGSFDCVCNIGYKGDGVDCISKLSQRWKQRLSNLPSSYSSEYSSIQNRCVKNNTLVSLPRLISAFDFAL